MTPLDCIHFGDQVGVSSWHECNHPDTPLGATVCKCNGCGPKCAGYANGVSPLTSTVVWEYGVTTVPSRRDDLLPRTLTSLARGGFPTPRLFVDGDADPLSWEREFVLPVTTRWPQVKTHANWMLSAYELYLRNPHADRYAIFQDDCVTYRNLRGYLDTVAFPEDGYLNLYTFPENQEHFPGGKVGWAKSNQRGLGAVALVFSLAGIQKLLSAQHMVKRVTNLARNSNGSLRAHSSVDGGIVTAMKEAGVFEYVHNPSLVQHIGEVSSMGNRRHPDAATFRGESFNALDLVTK